MNTKSEEEADACERIARALNSAVVRICESGSPEEIRDVLDSRWRFLLLECDAYGSSQVFERGFKFEKLL